MFKRINPITQGPAEVVFPQSSTPGLSIANLPSKFIMLFVFMHIFFFIRFSHQPVLEYFFLLVTILATFPEKFIYILKNRNIFFNNKNQIFLYIRIFIITLFTAIQTTAHIQYFLIQPYKVNQKSMLPEISPGELILVEKFTMGLIFNYYTNEGIVQRIHFPGSRPIQTSDIVVFHKPDSEDILIKRVIRIENNTYCVYGDNRGSSIDSRVFGCIPENKIIGRYFYKLKSMDALTLKSPGSLSHG